MSANVAYSAITEHTNEDKKNDVMVLLEMKCGVVIQGGRDRANDVFFFFSSRRRHTRLQGDWSSNVCSSDLQRQPAAACRATGSATVGHRGRAGSLLAEGSGLCHGRRIEAQSVVGRVPSADRSEEHTSELQSPCNLVCRLLLEKKKITLRLSMLNLPKPKLPPLSSDSCIPAHNPSTTACTHITQLQ